MSKHIIVVIGKVGTGKSTQIKHLASFFRRKGIKVKCACIKTFFPITLLFSKILVIFKYNLYHSLILIRLLVTLDLGINTAIIPFISLFKVRLSSYFADIILIEEYLPGILVDYFHLINIYDLNKELIIKLLSLLYRLLFINELTTVILFCSDSELRHRWRKRGTPDEDPSYLRMQELIFNFWSKITTKVVLINTSNKTINEVSKEIIKALKIYAL